MKVAEDFESRPHKAVLLWLKEKRRYRNGMSRCCRGCFLVTVEEGWRKKRTSEGDKKGVKLLKK